MEAGAVVLPQFKIAILGSQGCGKKSYIKSIASKQIEKLQDYINPQKNKPVTIQIQTNMGPMQILLQYVPSQLKQNQLNERNISYVNNCQGAILMFHVTQRDSYRNVPLYYRQIVSSVENIPICLVGNKVDQKDRKVKSKHIIYHRKKNVQYYEISATYNYNVLKPVIWIMRKITGNPQFQLIGGESLLVATNHIPEQTLQIIQQGVKQMQLANNIVLPDDSD